MELAFWEERAKRVTIVRDDYGVAHIYGKTDADVVFGLMYAQCEDDFPRVEENYLDALGRLSESLGESYFYQDVRARMYADTAQAKRHYAAAPRWMRDLLEAFAGGINFYLHRHPGVRPAVLKRFEPWMPLLFTEGSIGGNITIIPISGVRDFYENNQLGTRVVSIPEWEEEPPGSNGFAIGPAKTQGGHPLLLINPHTSFYFRTEVHLVSEQGLNTYGAITWGQFFVYQGFNSHCGWMHTSGDADVADEYLETVEKRGDTYFYLYEGKWRPVRTRREVIVWYKDGKKFQRELTLYFTHHGPVIARKDGKWVSIRMMSEQVKALSQSFLRTKANGLKEFEAVMKLNTNSSNNTVFADNAGNIAYWHGNFMPRRDIGFAWDKPVDGSTSRTEWQGFHSLREIVRIVNPPNGWLQNCNSDPFTAAGKDSPRRGDYPAYMAPDEENFRGLAALRLLENMRGNWTLDSLVKAAFDPYLPGFARIIPDLVTSVKDPDLAEPLGFLSSWNFERDSLSVATSLAIFYGEQIMEMARRQSHPDSQSILWLEKVVLERLDAGVKGAAMRSALQELIRLYGSWKIPWGNINRFQRIQPDIRPRFDDEKESIPVGFTSSAWGSLAAYGARTQSATRKRYGTLGNSFVAVVEFGPRVNAYSIVTGGASGNSLSPHFNDQSLRYTQGKFKKVHFHPEEVAAHTQRKYHP